MPSFDLPTAIEEAVSQRSLLQHPFYQAWSEGKLTLDDLRGYAKEYYWLAKHVPCIMDAIERNLPTDMDPALREYFARNGREEQEHIALWERFASALGISREELVSYTPTDTVKEAVISLLETAKSSYEEGIAAMYAFEVELPEISTSKLDGLKTFYDLQSEDAMVYFREHQGEEKHLALWRKLLRAIEEDKTDDALMAARIAVAAQNRVLDGVVERYMPEMECACVA